MINNYYLSLVGHTYHLILLIFFLNGPTLSGLFLFSFGLLFFNSVALCSESMVSA